MLAALTTLDKATIALVGVTGCLASLALIQLFAFNRSEARRTQPVAIAHRFRARDDFAKFAVHLTNEGTGTAFNVRFGVRLDGTEYAVGGGRGHRYVVAPGQRVPPGEGYLEVRVSHAPYALVKGGRDVDSRAVFWARYENAFGVVYETANPVDPLEDFTVHRSFATVRLLREKRQARKREIDEMIANRRVAEELRVHLDVRKLPWIRKIARRFGR